MNIATDEKIEQCMRLFRNTDRMHKNFCDRLTNKFGIHRSQHILLMHLSHSDSTVCQREIAERFDISPAAVAVSLKKLEKSGYIYRKASNVDSRFNEIIITPKGEHIVELSADVFDKIQRQMFKDFSDEEIETMIFYLEKIRKSLCEKDFEESV